MKASTVKVRNPFLKFFPLLTLCLAAFGTSCAEKPRSQIAFGQTENAYEKSSFLAAEYHIDSMDSTVAPFVTALNDNSVKDFKFEIGLNRLNILVPDSKGEFVAKYHWVIDGHYDFDRSHNQSGEQSRFLVLSTTINTDYRKRALIKVNPATFFSKDPEIDPYRFKVADVHNKHFNFGRTDIPGLTENIVNTLRQEHGLSEGDQLETVLDLLHYHLFFKGKEILRLPVDYFDLMVKRSPANDQWKDQVEPDKGRNWLERDFVKIQVDAPNFSPEDISIFAKKAFQNPSDPEIASFLAVVQRLVAGLEPTELVFTIEQNRLQIANKSAGSSPFGHWLITGHFDYDTRKKRGGDTLSRGELSNKMQDNWQDRTLIQVDPIDFRRKDYDSDLHFRPKTEIAGTSYEVGKDEIPGITPLILASLKQRKGLPGEIGVADGDKVTVTLTRSHLILYTESKEELVRLPIRYYDLSLKTDPATGYWQDRLELDQEQTWENREYVQIDPDGAEYTKKIDPSQQIDVLAKSVIDTEELYHYVPSVIEAPKNLDVTIPHYQGISKLVKFRFTEKMLQIFEVPPREEEFLDNTTNLPPVLSIPLKHLDYRCSVDEQGNCVDRKTEDNDMAWQDRAHFKPDFAKMEIREVNILPLMYMSYLVPQCFGEKEMRLIDFKFEGDALNIKVERSYRGNIFCMDIENLSDLAFNVTYHYSFVKAKALNSPDYETVYYPRGDEDHFGFFKTEFKTLDHVHSDLQANEKQLMNRWNPKRKVIKYYLNDQFRAPENKVFYDATVAGIERINEGLAKAAVGFRLEIANLDLEFTPDPGDIRYNMIMLVDDPGKYGLLGYGPSVVNPLTGEIINARTVMYGGIFKTLIQRAYQDVYRESLVEKDDPKIRDVVAAYRSDSTPRTGSQVYGAPLARLPKLNDSLFPALVGNQGLGIIEINVNKSLEAIQDKEAISQESVAMDAQGQQLLQNGFSVAELEEIAVPQPILEKKTLQESAREQVDRIAFMSENNAYSTEMIDFHDDLRAKILAAVGGKENIRPWLELSIAEQKAIVEKILPAVWTGTFIHEMGHNLGLRHNFKGSEDRDNFYSAEETQSGFVVPYSSIMDYGAKDLDELNQFGKYDIAALRFGYDRSVETNTGKFVKIPKTLTELKSAKNVVPKPYEYCSDEGVALNPLCKRFDLGTGYEEVADNIFKLYQDRYERANTRNGRSHFSLYDDLSYAYSINSTFRSLRLFFETQERIYNMFNVDYGTDFGADSWLTDLDNAVDVTYKNMLRTLTTPDRACVMVQTNAAGIPILDAKTKGPMIVAIAELRDFDQVSDRCTASRNIDKVRSLAQGGLLFQSDREPNNPNIYQDQIDTRGYWIDKLLAARWLLRRQVEYTFDKDYTGNYLDIGGAYEGELKKTLYDLFLDMYAADVEFTTNTGETFTQEGVVLSQASSHRIPKHLSSALRGYLQLPDETTTFAWELLRIIKKELSYADSSVKINNWLNKFSVYSSIPNGRENDPFTKILVNQSYYYVFEENELAVLLLNAIQATEFMQEYREQYGVAQLNKVYYEIGGQLTELLEKNNLKAVEKILANLNQDDINLLRMDSQIVESINDESKLEYFKDLLTRLVE